MPRTRSATRKLRPVIKYHGEKYYVARHIAPRLPPHEVYCEPCAGGLNVLLQKEFAPVEIAGDIDQGLINLYRTLQDRTEELMDRLGSVEYTRENFTWSLDDGSGDDAMTAALRYLVRRRFSRDSLGKDFSWSNRLRGGMPGDVNGWRTFRLELPTIARRLERVAFHCRDAVELIREHDGPKTFTCCDPPYLHETRAARSAYAFEMTGGDHLRLLDAIVRCRGAVIISGYPSTIYDEALADWDRVEILVKNNAAQTKQKSNRTEVLWLNPQCGGGRIILRG
jgi:DNA adenine methylase